MIISLFFYLNKVWKKSIYLFVLKKNVLLIYLNKKYIINYIFFLMKHLNIKIQQLLDLFVIDIPEKKSRFVLYYVLLNTFYNFRLFIKIFTNEQEPIISSTTLFKSANWLEREGWDLYGVVFNKHPDLRRILTDYGFQGYPFRKDFPLTGYFELRFDDSKKNILSEPLEITQEFRLFNFKSPWE